MKKIIILLVAFSMSVLFCACGGDASTDDAQKSNADTTQTTADKCANGHTEVIDAAVAPTCTQTGLTEGKHCSVCNSGILVQEEVPMTDHTWKEATCTEAKTCSVCKATEGNALGHTWADATCTEAKTCTVCKATEGSALGHIWTDATCTTPKTCEVCGKTEGDQLGHSMSDGFCTRCGYTSLKLGDVLSNPIQDLDSVQQLCNDGHVYSGNNFASYYNSADGLYLAWAATNTSSKTIKYLAFTVEFYNPVGDPARDSITGETEKIIRLIGPIEAGESFFFRKIVGYSSSCSSVKITSVLIQYMDGTEIFGYYNQTTHHKSYRTSGVPEIYVADYIN